MQLPLGALLHVWRLTCSCATSRSRPLTRRTSVHRLLVCCCMQEPLGALLHVWRLTCSCATTRSRPLTRRTSVHRSLVCCCMQLPLGALLHVWRLTCSCATTRSRPEQGAPLFLVHSFVVVCSCPWVPSCTFGASLAAARLHDLVL